MSKLKITFFAIVALCCGLQVAGQNINATIDKKQYDIGDAIYFKFRVPFEKGENQDLFYTRENSDTLELQATKTDTIGTGGKTFLEYTQKYMSFVPGVVSVGDSLFVRRQNAKQDSLYKVSPCQVEVLQYSVDTTKAEIKDIKGIKQEPFSFKEVLPVIYVVVILIALAAGLYFFVRYWKHRPKETKPQEQPKVIIPAHIKALQSLEDLRLKRLSEQGLKKQYYSELCEIIWTYFEERFCINATELTSEEILSKAKAKSEIASQDISMIEEIFTTADLVKFAKALPDEPTDKKVWNLAKDFVNDTTAKENPKTQEQ